MSDWTKARDGASMAKIAVHALELIQGITNIGGAPAVATLALIKGITNAVQDGFNGKTSPEVVLAELEAFRHSLAIRDADKDRKLERRFDTSDDRADDAADLPMATLRGDK